MKQMWLFLYCMLSCVQVDMINRTTDIDLSNYVENGEWELLSITVKRNVVYYACCVVYVTYYIVVVVTVRCLHWCTTLCLSVRSSDPRTRMLVNSFSPLNATLRKCCSQTVQNFLNNPPKLSDAIFKSCIARYESTCNSRQ